MKQKKIIIAAVITVVLILLLIIVAAAIHNNQPEDTLPSDIDSKDDYSDENSVLAQPETYRGWIINRLGYSYIYNDRALQQFNGTVKTAQNYASKLNKLEQYISSERVYSIIVPTQVEFLDIPAAVMAEDNFFCTSQAEAIFTSISAYKDIIPINITELLSAHKNEYLYFRTDYNWTSNAAYYAYIAFCDAAGITSVPLENYEKIELDGYLGWFYTATGSKVLLDNRDTIVYYRTEAEYPCYITVEQDGHKTYTLKYYGTELSADKGYDIFIGKEKAVCRFETRAAGGSLLVIGDTSVHAFLPFLMHHYSEIIFYNPLCFESDDSYTLPNADDVLFMSYATNANSVSYCEKMEGLINNE